MTRSHRTTTRLGMLAAIGAAFVITGCTAAPAPTTAPAAPSAVPAAPSAVPAASSAVPSPVAEAPVAPPAPDLVAQAPGSPAASDAVAREAGLFSRGTATCIWNGSGDTLQILIERSYDEQEGYKDTNGTVSFDPRTWRCTKGFSGPGLTPKLTVTIPSGDKFIFMGYNVEYGPDCLTYVTLNDVRRCMEQVGATGSYTMGRYSVTAKRVEDSGSTLEGGWISFEFLISG